MDANENQPCATCNSTAGYEEIAGMYYCLVCNNQRIGYTLEVRQFDDIGLLRLVHDTTKQKKSKKKFDPGDPWTMVEAFNIILNHQCSQLEKGLNLGDKFRAILFSLWTNYLAKCELAFTGEKEDQPKPNINSLYRDFQILGQKRTNVKELPKKESKSRKDQTYCGFIRFQRLCSVEIGASTKEDIVDYSDNDSDTNEKGPYLDDYGEVVGEKKHPTGGMPHESFDLDDLPIVEWTDDMPENLLYNFNYTAPAIDYRNDDSYEFSPSEELVDSSQPFSALATKTISFSVPEIKGAEVNGLTSRTPTKRPRANQMIRKKAESYLRRFDNGEDFDGLIQEVGDIDDDRENLEAVTDGTMLDEEALGFENLVGQEEDEDSVKPEDVELSKRSRLLDKIMGGHESKKVLNHSGYLTLERMTIAKTIQLILLAFKIGGYNVHVNDIMHWIFLGHLTYYGAVAVLPEDWHIVSNLDNMPLQPKQVFSANSIEYNTPLLREFLSIPLLPDPDFNEMVIRQLYDLNLPLRLADLIAKEVGWTKFSQITRKYSSGVDSKFLPCYEIFSICSIIVILKKIFTLDGETEILISKDTKHKWPESFVWSDWYNDNQELWKLITQHYFPSNNKLYNEIFDSEIIRNHRDKLSNKWFGSSVKCNQRFYFLTNEFKTEFSTAAKDAFEVPECAIEMPPFTVYHLHEAKLFISKRIAQINGSSSIFGADYTNKSINYLYDRSFNRFKDISVKKTRQYRISKLDEWPESLRLLIRLAAFITHRAPDKITWFVNRLDKLVHL